MYSRQGNVNQLPAFGTLGLGDFFFKLLECGVDLVFDSISKLSCGAPVFFRNFAYLCKYIGDKAFSAEVFYAELLQRRAIGDRFLALRERPYRFWRIAQACPVLKLDFRFLGNSSRLCGGS